MPELPEVETVCRTIAPHLVGRRILKVELRERRLRRLVARDLPEQLQGRTICSVRRRAKYVLIQLDDAQRWVVHLGMSGRLCVGEPPADLPHVHLVADLSDGGRLYFRDPRRFGLLMLSRDDCDLGVLGVEPLEAEFCADFLWRETRAHRRASIKALLMDQRIVVGIGNIYASEALFFAGVRPSRRAGSLRRAEVGRVVASAVEVLQRAIESRGSSLLDYRDGEGNEGEFQRSLRVYERAGDACRECATPIKRRVLAGRGSFYCPACQC